MTDQVGPAHDGSADGAREVWPVCAGSSFNLWEPDTGDYYDSVDAAAIRDHLHAKRLSQHQTSTSAFADLPAEVIKDPRTLPCLQPRIAFRDVTNPTNTRTFICALIPPRRVLAHQAPYLLQTQGSPADEAYVLGVLSSMIFDWQTRQTTELHMTFEQLNQTSIPDPGAGHPVRDRVATIAGRLAAADGRFKEWAQQTGATPAPVPDDEREELLVELDACVAVLYGLDAADIAVLYDTFGRVDQWARRRDAVIATLEAMPQPSAAAP